MEKPPQSFDVCIVCALPEEVRVFLEVVRQQGEGALEEHISPRYHYSYRFTTIKNNHDESLNLHISWLPRYGPQEMTLHLSRVLEEYQPRMAIMTGICAGDSQHVQLGDLVVAERTFTYDNGKFTLDEHGRSVHLHDTVTYQLDANILQFLGLFDDWKPLVAALKRPPSSPEQRKRRKIACHLKAMASGNAVRADRPFEEIRAPVRGTVAIDMEGAAFGLVMSRHPLIRWLVVKGVCDYADQNKNDAYHDYAAHASALYALVFIRSYVTNERLPRPDEPSPSSRAGPSEVWNIPFARNPFFTGREDLLEHLHTQLQTMQTAALSQPQAINGLGGIGKTQLAIEYAYRYRQEYQMVLWAHADTTEALNASYIEIAKVLQLPQKDAQKQEVIVQAVKAWLRTSQGCLMIFDNADELRIIQAFLPNSFLGHLVFTTRAQAPGKLAQRFEVDTMGTETGALLLLRRAGLVAANASLDAALPSDLTLASAITKELGGLPLALDQAGAYIEETACGLAGYQRLYQTQRTELLRSRGGFADDHPESVATTWSLSFAQVEQLNPAAADLLRLCAFLAPDAIPEELLTEGAQELGEMLAPVAADAYLLNQAITALRAYSLLTRDPQAQTLTVHRLVQAVLRDSMPAEIQQQWMQRAVHAVEAAYPGSDFANWLTLERLLPHAFVCATWIEQAWIETFEAAHLLNNVGFYLKQRGRYVEAEPLYQRALTIFEQQLGLEHPNTATSLNNLAILYVDQGKYAEAEPLYQRALIIREQQLGPEHPNTAISLGDLASLYRSQGKYAEAEPLYQRALAIHEQQLGPEHPHTATSLNNLATLYVDQGKYAEAEPLYQRALIIREQQLGPEHPHTATSLNNLAALYWKQGEYAKAEPLYQHALAIKERQLGPDHPNTATSLNNLAELYRAQERYAEAEPLCQRALAIDIKIYGAEHPNVAVDLNTLAGLYQAQGRYGEAEPLYQRALAIHIQQSGGTHPSVATILNNLALLYQTQGNYKEAEPLYQRALAIHEQQLGTEHPNTQIARNNYTTILFLMKHDEEEG